MNGAAGWGERNTNATPVEAETEGPDGERQPEPQSRAHTITVHAAELGIGHAGV